MKCEVIQDQRPWFRIGTSVALEHRLFDDGYETYHETFIETDWSLGALESSPDMFEQREKVT